MHAVHRARRGLSSVIVVLCIVLASLSVPLGGAARADTAPADPTTPATVSADALPTVQINGIVWSQVTVGNVVYATGSFSSARPAGAPPGTNETPRSNLLAYDITTGNLITSFNHSLNAQGLFLAASPDGKRVYLGGDFTTVDGVTHSHLAAFDTATGALVTSFSPSVNNKVLALTATNTTVYAGGVFTVANNVARARLAAFSAASGALLPWAPKADDSSVVAMVLSPDGSKVVLGGRFSTLNGVSARGLGWVEATSGATVAMPANNTVYSYGTAADVNSLRVDSRLIYATAYNFGGTGNLEGAAAIDGTTGNLVWVEDCHGDTYDSLPMGNVLYTVSHEHYCGNIGGFPQTDPWTFRRATAFTTYATQTISHDPYGYYDWYGTPAPTQLHWYPELTAGTVSGASQAAWSLTGNGSFIALGGEFPKVNNAAQQGLVRFAVKSSAPNKVAPRYDAQGLTPTVTSYVKGQVRLSWTGTYDYDNENLTYQVIRDGLSKTPIYSSTVSSKFWGRPPMGFVDTGVAPGSTHSYIIFVKDPLGNLAAGPSVSVTVSNNELSAYANDIRNDGASNYWRLSQPAPGGAASSGTAYDYAGFNDLSTGLSETRQLTGAISGDDDTATGFDGSSGSRAVSKSSVPTATTLSLEAWVRTTSTAGGKVVGLGNSANTTNSSNYDRHLYVGSDGKAYFGVYDGQVDAIASANPVNDGQWHHLVGTLSASDGMVFYVDGARSGAIRRPVVATPYSGSAYWHVGGDSLGSWTGAPSSNDLQGTIDEVAVYPTVLSYDQVTKHYTDSGRISSVPAAPTDAYGKAVVADSPSSYLRLAEAGGPAANDQMRDADGGTYNGGVTFGVSSPVGDPGGKAIRTDGSSGGVTFNTALDSPSTYSEEVWFQTTTTDGGKIIGFGNNPSGSSGAYDRHVWMQNDGSLVFGTYTGATNVATSRPGYNDGVWHHLVATQGSDGMKLYVDGGLVGSNSQTQAQGYVGYWKLGGDNVWYGANSNYFAGSLDEAAVYATVLPASRVLAHFKASPVARNAPPNVVLTKSCTGLSCTFDGSGTSDSDGSVVSYAWDFGDGATATTKTAGAQHAYGQPGTYSVTLTALDNEGATASVSSTVKVATLPTDAYGKAVAADGPSTWWRLDDAQGSTTAVDSSLNGIVADVHGGVSFGTSNQVVGTGNAATFDGSTGEVVSSQQVDSPSVYSEELWFRTTTSQGGKLIGFGNSPSGESSSYDRHVWMQNDGSLVFGTWTGQTNTAASGPGFNDGRWHHLVAAQGGDGMHLYLDGAQVASNPQTSAQTYTGYFRLGGDHLWFGASSDYFSGDLDEAAVYIGTELTPQQVAAHSAARLNQAPNASATATSNFLVASFNGTASSDPDGTVTAYTWDFGDGATGTGATVQHTYRAAGSYTSTLTIKDDQGATATATVNVVVTTVPNAPPVAAFTSSAVGLKATFDGTTSSDSDGTLLGYAWDFGDGGAATTATPFHTYAADGTYTVRLVVTDDGGAASVATQSITVARAANVAPTASFSQASAGLSASFDGSASSDGDGEVVGYGWDFGDGSTGSGPMVSHAYGAPGSYTATLTVTDDRAGTGTASKTFTVDVPPAAAFTATAAALSVSFDGSSSSAADGKLLTYAWAFGDGQTATTAKPIHAYAASGTYTVALTVTDSFGLTATATKPVTVAPINQAPIASFTAGGTFLTVSVDGSGSSDPDGSIASFAWDFGDGAVASGVTPMPHQYASPGNYTVRLTVTDDKGATGTTTKPVTAAAVPNQAPTASFTTSPNNLTVSFDGTSSSDPDGTVTAYSWDFGDGVPPATDPTTVHTYRSGGTYEVALSVTDNRGATNTATQSVTVIAPIIPNQPPVATFSLTSADLTVGMDANASSDPDGTLTGYIWDFGDGTSGGGKTTTHAFVAAGDYRITLTVTDDKGSTATSSQVVSPRPQANPAVNPYAVDLFNRSTTRGLGSADQGGAWSTAGSAANFSVVPGNAAMNLPAATNQDEAWLPSVSATDSDTSATLAPVASLTGNGVYATVTGRRVSATTAYRARVRLTSTGSVTLALSRLLNGTDTLIGADTAIPGLTAARGNKVVVRLQVTGTNPTRIRAKIWMAGTPEPATWQASVTDSSSGMQMAGSVGLVAYLPNNATAANGLTVSAFSSQPSTSTPTASFAASCAGATCTADGSGSTDDNAPLTGYTWSWGDGVVTAGSRSSHTYAAPGTYRITLTVTNSAGRPAVTTRTISV